MSVKRLVLPLALILVLSFLGLVAFGLLPALSVSTDKAVYRPGEVVTITVTGTPGVIVGVQCNDPQGNPAFVKQLTIGATGSATTSFKLGSDAPLGRWTVYVSGGGETATTSFYVKQPSTITIVLGKTVLGIGESFRISGDIDPDPGTSVTVTLHISGPVTVDVTVETAPDGGYSVLYTPPKGGTYEVYAEWAGTETISGSRSDTASFTVRKLLTNITVTVTPANITYGESVVISGRIEPAEAGANQEVFLTLSLIHI